MNNSKPQQSRRSIRLKEYDYSNPGWYYVTICTKNFIRWFGNVKNGKVNYNALGNTACKYFEEIPKHFKIIELDYFVIMPNHIHGIIIINDCRGVQLNTPTRMNKNYFSQISPPKGSLGVIIRTFKGAVKKWCNQNGIEKFKWQRNYYDHIIRNDKDLHRIRTYIQNNPLKWELDEYYNS